VCAEIQQNARARATIAAVSALREKFVEHKVITIATVRFQQLHIAKRKYTVAAVATKRGKNASPQGSLTTRVYPLYKRSLQNPVPALRRLAVAPQIRLAAVSAPRENFVASPTSTSAAVATSGGNHASPQGPLTTEQVKHASAKTQ
jgi:hypothetical protein